MSVGCRLSVEGRRTIRERLITEVGGYLRKRGASAPGDVRGVRDTHPVCLHAVPALPAGSRRVRDELADLVVPLCYGIKGSQSGYLMHSYKDLEAPARHNQTLLSVLLLAALDAHGDCIEQRLGYELDAWAIVPSARTDRSGEHPLHVVTKRAGIVLPEIGLAARAIPTSENRATNPERFAVCQGSDAPKRHILLIEDTWTSGGNVQSAALTLRRAGAATVTIVALSRWLKPEEPSAAAFLRHIEDDYDPLLCPLDEPVCRRPSGT